jgi:Cu/Ag efflux protein CusF
MLKKFTYVLTTLLVTLSMLAVTVPAFALGNNSSALVKGTIVAVNTAAHILTVKPSVGKSVNVKVPTTTLITRSGKASSFSKLRVGDKTSLKYDTVTKQASRIDDSTGLYEIHGTVETVDSVAGRITIASEEGGNSVTLTVSASTVITRNKVVATLVDLVTGDKVEAKYNSATMLASLIKSEVEDMDFHGTIAALNFAGNTVTITPSLGGADVVLKIVASTVFVTHYNVVIPFTALHVGNQVEAAYDSTSQIASKIKLDH